jgi:hypothetical protein
MKCSTLTRLGAACAGTVVAVGLAAAPAFASPSVDHQGAARASGPLSHPVETTTTSTPDTPYLGGFFSVPSLGPVSISSTFTIPKATCANKTDYEDIFIGEELVESDGNNYDGGETDAAADVVMYCAGDGKVIDLIEAYTVNGADNVTQVKPGDKVQTLIVDSPNGETEATTTDLTHYAQEDTTADSTGESFATYDGVVPNITYEGQSSDDYIPKFKTIKFSDSQINGADFNASSPVPSPYALDQTGTVQIVPGTLAAATKPSPDWSVTEKSAL